MTDKLKLNVVDEQVNAFQFINDTGRPILTISREGKLTFGPDAHPQDVVDMLMKVWQDTITFNVTVTRAKDAQA